MGSRRSGRLCPNRPYHGVLVFSLYLQLHAIVHEQTHFFCITIILKSGTAFIFPSLHVFLYSAKGVLLRALLIASLLC